MFHDMSPSTTSTRVARGIVVPAIDTRGLYHLYHRPHVLSQWSVTPSPSALDSRRPSLAYSSFSDAPSFSNAPSFSDASHSGPSSISTFSQPATPAHSMVSSAENVPHQWHEAAEREATCALDLNHHPPIFHHLALASPSMPMMSSLEPARADAWQQPTCAPDLAHSMVDSLYRGASSPFQHLVVPSQLGPHADFRMDHYPVYDGPDDLAPDFSHDLDCGGGWESVGPHSPLDASMTAADEDYVLVKQEELSDTPSRPPVPPPPASLCPRRRPKRLSRRARKSCATANVFYEADNGYCHVRCEGKPFTVTSDSQGRVCVHHETSKVRPHKCLDTKPDGTPCNATFDRAEKLKRHASSHSDDRPYPCPLPGCHQRPARSDNAKDHFKTHLRAGSKKRNPHFEFATLEEAMLCHPAYIYPDNRKAVKMLGHLKDWYEKEMVKGRLSG